MAGACVPNRIVVDLDSKNMFHLLKTYFNAKQLGEVEVEETRKGYHIIIRRSNNPRENIYIRMLLGDDPKRLEYDEILGALGFRIDVSFKCKWSTDYGWHLAEPVNPLSLPWKLRTWRGLHLKPLKLRRRIECPRKS